MTIGVLEFDVIGIYDFVCHLWNFITQRVIIEIYDAFTVKLFIYINILHDHWSIIISLISLTQSIITCLNMYTHYYEYNFN